MWLFNNWTQKLKYLAKPVILEPGQDNNSISDFNGFSTPYAHIVLIYKWKRHQFFGQWKRTSNFEYREDLDVLLGKAGLASPSLT